MKKMCYEIEKIKLIYIVLVMQIFAWDYFFIKNEILHFEGDTLAYCFNILSIIFHNIILCAFLWKVCIGYKVRYKKVKDEGIRYDGRITGFDYVEYKGFFDLDIYLNKIKAGGTTYDKGLCYENYFSHYHRYNYRFKYILTILYNNTIIKTPIIAFNPIKDLGSKDCEVYVLDDEFYVTGFMPRRREDEIIWSENNESVINTKQKREYYGFINILQKIFETSIILIWMGILINTIYNQIGGF